MKIYLNKNVLQAALERIRFLFDEFEQVAVCYSGGKDSTVIFELTMQVAQELNRLPLPVLFIDQEAEWQATIDQMRKVMYRKDVKPYWYQMPMKISNSTSFEHEWLYCWEPGREWMREREPIAIKENIYGEDRFKILFKAIPDLEFKDKNLAFISGIRTEESPARLLGMTNAPCYKWITWGQNHKNFQKHSKGKNHISFYPIYDWSYSDVWKAISEHQWEYCRIYDDQYRLGRSLHDMRVSSLHHETSLQSLYYMQEAEPETHDKLTARLQGVNSTIKFDGEYIVPKEPPYMFRDWVEYRDFLLERLISAEKRPIFAKRFKSDERKYRFFEDIMQDNIFNRAMRVQVVSMLANDWFGTKLENLRASYSNRYLRHLEKKYWADYWKGEITGDEIAQRENIVRK